tara:strand:- start:11661 stop:12077 length:417 start_codon:yes stop_codon:yes gene_type:complete
MTTHTDAFNRIFDEGVAEPTFVEAENFVMRLSEKTSDEVVSKIISATNKTYTTNKEIYMYCKKNGIKQDHDPYDNYSQPELNFNEPIIIDYTVMKSMDDVEIDGRNGFVVSNNLEAKTIVIEFNDTEEMETINYAENE